MCPYQTTCMMGHPMNMFPPYWSQQQAPKASAPKQKKNKPPKRAMVESLEEVREVAEFYNNWLKDLEEKAVRKDKEKNKPKKKEGFNLIETSMICLIAAPFIVIGLSKLFKLLGL